MFQKIGLVESKSFKIYIQSFRNYGIFHEDAVMKIGVDLFKSIKPVWFRIAGYFALEEAYLLLTFSGNLEKNHLTWKYQN